jgi:hypothetical protein
MTAEMTLEKILSEVVGDPVEFLQQHSDTGFITPIEAAEAMKRYAKACLERVADNAKIKHEAKLYNKQDLPDGYKFGAAGYIESTVDKSTITDEANLI